MSRSDASLLRPTESTSRFARDTVEGVEAVPQYQNKLQERRRRRWCCLSGAMSGAHAAPRDPREQMAHILRGSRREVDFGCQTGVSKRTIRYRQHGSSCCTQRVRMVCASRPISSAAVAWTWWSSHAFRPRRWVLGLRHRCGRVAGERAFYSRP